MTGPIAPGTRALSPSPPSAQQQEVGKIRSAAMAGAGTPARQVPVVDMNQADPSHVRIARGMEAMFLDYMMQAMRKTVPEDEMGLHNAGTRIYQGMLDSEMAQKAAGQGGMGLAEQIVAYLQSQRYNSKREQAVPAETSKQVTADGTGGTHEGQSVQ